MSRSSTAAFTVLSLGLACGAGSSGSSSPPGPSQPPTPTPPTPPQTETLSLDLTGQGTADVVTQGGTSSCQGSCTVQVTSGSSALIVAHPGDGFVFQGFGNVCSGAAVRGSGDCNVTVNGPVTVNVVFNQVATPPPSKATLAVNRTGNGQCSVVSTGVGLDCGTTCQVNVDLGVSVVLAVQPDKDSAFVGWKGGECDGSKDPTCDLHMDKDHTVSARCMKIVCSVDP